MKVVTSLLTAVCFLLVSSAFASNEGAVAVNNDKENEAVIADTTSSSLSSGWLFSGSGKHVSLQELQQSFSSVPPETVTRFYSAFGNDSTKRLTAYLEWKGVHNVRPSTGDDSADWTQAAAESFSFYTSTTGSSDRGGNLRGSSPHAPSFGSATALSEHQVLFAPDGVTDKEGHTVFHMLPLRMDLGMDRATEIFANTFATYLETKMEGKPSDKITVFIDARPGRGWANPEITK